MAKSKPIGVRFDEDILDLIKKEQNLKTPQAVLNYFMNNYGKITPNLAYNSKMVQSPTKNTNSIELPKNDIKEPTKKTYNPFNNPIFKNKF